MRPLMIGQLHGVGRKRKQPAGLKSKAEEERRGYFARRQKEEAKWAQLGGYTTDEKWAQGVIVGNNWHNWVMVGYSWRN